MTNPNYTHLSLIVDRSGSMALIRDDMEGAIKTLLSEQGALPGELHVDVATFDSVVEFPYEDVRADDIKDQLIAPRGMTALNDAIGKVVFSLGERLAALDEDDRPGHVIVAIVTDGGENSSTEYTLAAVKALVERQQNEFGWQFMFFGAESMDAFGTAEGYGIGRGQTISFANNSDGVSGYAAAASANMTRTRSGLGNGFTDEDRAAASGRNS